MASSTITVFLLWLLVSPFLPMDPDNEVVLELIPYIRIYKSGRLERLLGTDIAPATVDLATGVTSKDVVIDPSIEATARLYLPNLSDSPAKKLPILVYYHGGGFIIETAFSPLYHNYLNPLTARGGFLVVSLNYRRAPEYPLPIAFNDSWIGLQWVASHAAGGGPEAWLTEYGDFERVFLAGDSAGATICHQLAIRAGAEGLASGVEIEAMAMIHPYFLGSEPVGSEPRDEEWWTRAETIWRFVCPSTTGLDDPLLNPVVAGAPSLAGLASRRVLVAVAEKDPLKDRGRLYYEALVASGWRGEAELVETEGEEHIFHLWNPTTDKALAFMKQVVDFLNCE